MSEPQARDLANFALLDEFPIEALLARPLFDEHGTLVDFEVEFANQKFVSREVLPVAVGDRFSSVLPELLENEWLNRAQADHYGHLGSPEKNVRFDRNGIPYEVTNFWLDGYLYIHINQIDPNKAIRDGLPHALQVIFGTLGNLPFAAEFVTEKHSTKFASDYFLRCLGESRDRFDEVELELLVYPPDRAEYLSWLQRADSTNLLIRYQGSSGTMRWVELVQSEMRDLAGTVHGVLYLVVDVDEQVSARVLLQEQNRFIGKELSTLKTALNASRDGFAIWTKRSSGEQNGFYLDFMNDAGAQASGKTPDELRGMNLSDILQGEEEGLVRLFNLALKTGVQQTDIMDISGENGWVGSYENHVVKIGTNRLLASFRDISEDRREKRRLEWLVRHDALTGLLSRGAMESELERRLTDVRLTNACVGFAFLDLDDFKRVNDEFGHQVGDEVLMEFGAILREELQEQGLVARISGDEFALIFDGIDLELQIDTVLKRAQARARRGFTALGGQPITFCGGAVLVESGSHATSEILRMADRAMYSCKHRGKDRFALVAASQLN